MEKAELLKTLNWFYSLEKQQVQLYQTQAKHVKDIYLQKALERFAAIEQGHVENIRRKIEELGGTPTFWGKVAAPVGVVAGKITSLAGVVMLLKADVTLEEKAMHDYKNLILKVNDNALFDLLWSNLIDEDLHSAWMANKARELEKAGY